MPTYEYECPKCGHTFEEFQSMSDEPVKVCPECKGRKVRRLIGGGAGILFKGSGFYGTDYRSDSYKKREKQDSQSNSTKKTKDTPGPAKKTESKTAAKPTKDKA